MTTTAHVLPGQSLGGKVSRIVDRISPAWCLVILYALFVLVQTLVNGYCKHIETYMDEWVYYGFAESLAKGMGFPTIYGEEYAGSTRYLYSLLIAPCLLVSSRMLQFRLVAMLNALAIGSGVFPVYLLAKRVLKENKCAILAGVVYLMLPDMEFTATFMTENIWLPIALWVIWFFFRLVSDEDASLKTRLVNIALLVLFSIVLVNVKGSGISIVVALVLYYVIYRALQFITGKGWENKKIVLLIGLLFLVCVYAMLFLMLARNSDIAGPVLVAGTDVSTHVTEDPAKYAWGYVYTWATDILSMGIFPFVLPLLSFRKLSPLAKRLFLLAVLLTFVANLGITNTSLGVAEQFEFSGPPLYHRYKMYIWILYIIPFLYALMHKPHVPLAVVGLVVIATLTFCLVFKGLDFTSAVDMTMLHWAADWLNHWKLWVVVVVSFVCVGLLLLRLGHKRLFGGLFLCVMLVVTVYNHYAMHQMIEVAYGFDYAGIESVEQFIKDNPNDTFLVVTLPTNVKTDDVHYNAKVADTYLSYPNTMFASGKKIAGMQTDQGIDLAEVGMDDTGISVIGPRRIDSVDYIVLTTEMSIDESGCEQVLESDFFNIYRPDDSTKIPYMQNVDNWYLPGKTTLQPEAGFSSNYYKDDNMVYISGENPDYVLYGPLITLQPGRYLVTVHYSYEGVAEGKIGTMSLQGSTLNADKHQKNVLSDWNTVSLSFDLLEKCDAFEVCMFADVSGIQVESIDVEMLALRLADEAGLKVKQFTNANGMLVREEYYTDVGDKTLNENGFFAVDYSSMYGNRVSNKYYGINGALTITANDYAEVRFAYDAHRRIIREEYYGVEGEQVSRFGYHSVNYTRNEYGDIIEYKYLDMNDNLLQEGYTIGRKYYDDKHRVVREEFYDSAYEPVLRYDGCFRIDRAYDRGGNVIEIQYYDLNQKLHDNSSGFARVIRTYDSGGKLLEEKHYHADGTEANVT